MSYNLLKGKKGIIFGALNEMSIAWKVAEKCLEEGAEIVLTNTELSIRMGQIKDFAEKNNVPLIPADATSEEDLERLFKEAMELLGGKIDFILHSVAMSLNVRKKRPYDNLDYDFLQKTLDISAISFHKVLQTAKKLDAINEWGLLWRFHTWLRSVPCSNIMIWRMPRRCWSLLPVVSGIFTDEKNGFVSTRFHSPRR